MIQVNQLYIDSDKRHLVIDASIIDSTMYKDIVFDSIHIDDAESYIENHEGSKGIDITDNVSDVKHISITVNTKEDNPIYFITFKTKGTPLPPVGMDDMPCTWDENVLTEVICDMSNIYKNALNYISETADSCIPSKSFIDFILQYNMLKACLHTGAYNEAIKYWNKLNLKKTECGVCANKPKPCGCHG